MSYGICENCFDLGTGPLGPSSSSHHGECQGGLVRTLNPESSRSWVPSSWRWSPTFNLRLSRRWLNLQLLRSTSKFWGIQRLTCSSLFLNTKPTPITETEDSPLVERVRITLVSHCHTFDNIRFSLTSGKIEIHPSGAGQSLGILIDKFSRTVHFLGRTLLSFDYLRLTIHYWSSSSSTS